MLSIYGISGQVFSGTLEAMDRVNAMTRARHARAIAQEGDELGVEAVASRPREDAIRAYRQMIHRDLERGPLYHAAQIMSHPVITVGEDHTVASAWKTLRAVITDPPLSLWR